MASAASSAAYIVVCNGEYNKICMESLIEEMLASSYTKRLRGRFSSMSALTLATICAVTVIYECSNVKSNTLYGTSAHHYIAVVRCTCVCIYSFVNVTIHVWLSSSLKQSIVVSHSRCLICDACHWAGICGTRICTFNGLCRSIVRLYSKSKPFIYTGPALYKPATNLPLI